MNKIFNLSLIPLALAGGVFFAEQASAALGLKFSDGVNPDLIITDGVSPDFIAETGAVGFVGSFGSFDLNITSGTSKDITGSAEFPALSLTSTNVTSTTGPADLTIELTDTDFTGTPLDFISSVSSSITNHIGEFLTLDTYIDTTNTAFGKGTLLSSLGPNEFIGFNEADTERFDGTGPYSLTIVASLADITGEVNFDANIDAEPIPEPLTILGTGLALGFGGLLKNKNGKKQSVEV